MLMNIPNIPNPEMPEGKDDADNVTIKKWGKIPEFDFVPKEHSQLGKDLDIIDVEKAAEVSGSRFYYMKGDLVLMQYALTQFVLETLTNEKVLKQILKQEGLEHLSSKPFIPMIPPVMIRHDVQHAIHRVFGDQTYKIEKEDLNLVASAEHTLAPYHMNEVLEESQLPKRYIGISTSFRREAGTYGADMGGIFRCHQFDKSEMESFTTAETGADEQKFIVAIQEYLMQQLAIPYQLQQVCTGDTGKPDHQQYDIEA
jgi:seryl-tRNA synthetase